MMAFAIGIGAFFFAWYKFTRNQPHLPTEPEYTYMQVACFTWCIRVHAAPMHARAHTCAA